MKKPGILLVDKPAGPTSHDVVRQARRLLGRGARVGHCGTLDPAATGLLLLTLGAATRLSRFFVGLDKVYTGRIRLGSATDTLDAQGQLVAEAPVPADLSLEQVYQAARRFQGTISQVAPVYSAIRVQGRRLHRLARAGEEVAPPERRIQIHGLDILAFDPPLIDFRVHCSSGTYVRSLARDVGAELGLPAHLESLRRTAVGIFAIDQAAAPPETLQELEARLLPAAQALSFLPALRLDEEQVRQVRMGQGLRLADQLDPPAPEQLCLLDPAGLLVSVAEVIADESPFMRVQPRVVLPQPRVVPRES